MMASVDDIDVADVILLCVAAAVRFG